MAQLTNTFKCVHVAGLSPTTIRVIRVSCQPSYTDGNDDINDLFRVSTVVEWLEEVKDEPLENEGTFTDKEYQDAINELKELGHELEPFDYFSLELAD